MVTKLDLMLDNSFCEFLEYELTQNLKPLGLWCDGILLPMNEDDYSKKNINSKREVVISAFIGKTGQDKYQLQLILGNKALSRYARDLSIQECIPKFGAEQWIKIDTVNLRIQLQLL